MKLDTSHWTAAQQRLWKSLSPEQQSLAATGGSQSALRFVENHLATSMQHLRGTVGAGVMTGRADKMQSLMPTLPQAGVQPQEMLAQLQSLSTLGPLGGAASVLQPFVQELTAMMEGPLQGWSPQSAPPSVEPLMQFAQLLPALLQEMSQIPLDGFLWPSPGLSRNASSPLLNQASNAIGGARAGAPSLAKSAATSAVSSVRGVQAAQPLQSGVKPLTKSTIRDVGSKINRATKKDKDAIAISKDPQAMALATPSQKGRIINNLIKGHTTDADDRAITRVLESCTSKAEYDAVLKAAGGEKRVRKELDDKGAKRTYASVRAHWSKPENAKSSTPPKTGPGSTYRNQVAAFKQEAAKWKLDTDVPAAKGMTAQEAVAKYEQIAKARSDDDVGEKLAKDTRAMALATVEDKSAMVRRLIKGHTTDPQDRAMVDILESCTSKEEFDKVMAQSGGKDVVDEIDHGPSKEKMNMLAGAYGRKEWSNNAKQASLAENALIDPKKGAELAGLTGAGAVGELDPATLPKDPVERDIAIQRHKNRQRSSNIHREPRAYKELIFENAKRKAAGREPLDWSKANAEVTKAMEEVEPKTRKVTLKHRGLGGKKKLEVPVDQSSGAALQNFLKEKGLADEYKVDKVESGAESRKRFLKPKLEELRKKYGVGKEEMRDMFTYRQGEIHRTGAKELSQSGSETLRGLQERYSAAVQQHGPESAEAKQAKATLDTAKARLGAEVGRMSETAESAEGLYPTPLSGMDKFVGFFEKWGELILDVLATALNAIPGVGTALYAGYQGIKFIVKAAQEDVVGALTSLGSAVTGVGGAVTGVASSVLKGVGAAIHSGVGIANAVETGNPIGVVNALGSAAGGVGSAIGKAGEAAATASKVLDYTKKGLNAAGAGATMIQGLADNNLDQALSGLGGVVNAGAGFAGGDAKDILSGVGQGIQGVNDLVHGRVGAGLGRLQNSLEPAIKGLTGSLPPATQATLREVEKLVAPGVGLVDGLVSGDVSKATHSLLNLGTGALGHIPEVKAFLQQPEVQKALSTVEPLSRFVDGLAKGDIGAAMAGSTEALSKLFQQPELRKALGWANDLGQVLSAVEQQDTRKTLDALQKSGLLKDFLGGVQSGAFGEGIRALGKDVEGFFQNPHVKELGSWLTAGTKAVQGLVNGDTSGALKALTDPRGPLANRQELAPLLDFVNKAEPFLTGVTSGSLDQALGQLSKSFPGLFQQPELQTAIQNVAPFLGLLSNLQTGSLSGQFERLLTGLQPLQETDAMISQLPALQQFLGDAIQSAGSLERLLLTSPVMNPPASGNFHLPLRG